MLREDEAQGPRVTSSTLRAARWDPFLTREKTVNCRRKKVLTKKSEERPNVLITSLEVPFLLFSQNLPALWNSAHSPSQIGKLRLRKDLCGNWFRVFSDEP